MKMIKIGPFMQIRADASLNMQEAYDCDIESGSHWLSEEKSQLLNREFPTVCAMADLIEKERNQLRRQVATLQRILNRYRKGKHDQNRT